MSIKKDFKKKLKAELEELIKNKKTVLLASIKDMPSSQFQEIAKKLREKAIVKVPKKSILFRALDSSGKEILEKLKDYFKENTAILFSDMDAFELAGELANKKSPVKAKAGQESVKDIEIPEGPTDLMPGPAITELGALGIQIKIEKGKIHIREPKVIVKEGEKISAAAAEIMNKFNIKPFSIGFIPLAAFDTQEEKLYLNIKIDKEKTVEEIKKEFKKALAFAVQIHYVNKDTIGFLIRKAVAQEKAFEKFAVRAEESKDVEKKEEASEDKAQKAAETEKSKNADEQHVQNAEIKSSEYGAEKDEQKDTQTQTPKENSEENK